MRTLSSSHRIMIWNVRSVAKDEKLEGLLQILEDRNIYIACITETWFDRKNGKFTKSIKDSGFEINHAFREDKRGGGCAIIFKKNLSIKKGDVSSTTYSSFEYSVITLNMNSGSKILIACLYRKQEIAYKIFHEEMSSFMNTLFKSCNNLLVVGDFNVWIEQQDNKDAVDLSNLMNGFGLTQLVQDSTQNSGHTLDHVYLNTCQLSYQCEVLTEQMGLASDHYPIELILPMCKSEKTIKTVFTRKMKHIDLTEFKDELQQKLQTIDLDNTTFEQHMDQFDCIARTIVEKHAPMVQWRKKEGEPDWIDLEYKKNRALRRRQERIWKKHRTADNMNKYIEQKEVCIKMAMEKQKEYYTKRIADAGKCQKTLFKIANELLDKTSERVLPTHSDSKQLADDFNDFYIKKVEKIRNAIPKSTTDLTFCTRPFHGQRLDMFEPTTDNEICEIIKQYGVKTSVEDPIPAVLLKSAKEVIIPMYTMLVNKSLSEGSMETVKSQVIDPLLKKSGLDIDVKNNYRPVNNLKFFSKLTERVVKKRLDMHMNIHDLNEPSQFGYKKNHNTETMMIGLFDEALRAFDENQATVIIFLDLSAAFDTINHEKLLQIMEYGLGISEVALKWFRSFLTGRTVRVNIDNNYFDSAIVTCRTPHGSILGSPLFNINVRSQPKVLGQHRLQTIQMVDDHLPLHFNYKS